MNIIKEELTKEIIVNKSKFISLIFKVTDVSLINNYLDKVKQLFKNADHYCYAYRIDNNIKYSDDKEPIKTAGMPILSILEHQNINYVLCIVVRYFGGSKLGVGLLTRSYSKACREVVKNNIIIYNKKYTYKLNIPYTKITSVDYLLKDYIINKCFENEIIYTFQIENQNDKLLSKLSSFGKLTFLEEKNNQI
ncbi:MAG: YigZ family protein [Bacilli bacterium]